MPTVFEMTRPEQEALFEETKKQYEELKLSLIHI